MTSISGVPDPSSRPITAYATAYARAFPGIPANVSLNPDVVGFRDSMEAVLRALAAVHGDLGPGGVRLQHALASLTLTTTAGPIHLDGGHQAVATIRLERIEGGAATGPTLRLVRSIPEVDQTVGGLFAAADAPASTPPACRAATPPPWAR